MAITLNLWGPTAEARLPRWDQLTYDMPRQPYVGTVKYYRDTDCVLVYIQYHLFVRVFNKHPIRSDLMGVADQTKSACRSQR